MGVETARPTETGSFISRFRGRDKVRLFRVAAVALAALLALPATAPAQPAGKTYAQAAGTQPKRPVLPSTSAARHSSFAWRTRS